MNGGINFSDNQNTYESTFRKAGEVFENTKNKLEFEQGDRSNWQKQTDMSGAVGTPGNPGQKELPNPSDRLGDTRETGTANNVSAQYAAAKHKYYTSDSGTGISAGAFQDADREGNKRKLTAYDKMSAGEKYVQHLKPENQEKALTQYNAWSKAVKGDQGKLSTIIQHMGGDVFRPDKDKFAADMMKQHGPELGSKINQYMNY